MKHVALALALCLAASSHAATVYNCNGTYQQTPCGDGVDATVNTSGAGQGADTALDGAARLAKYRRDNIVEDQIKRGVIAIGMTASEVRRSWGEPTTINRSIRTWGTSEQWVYRDGADAQYVYFDDGIVSSITD